MDRPRAHKDFGRTSKYSTSAAKPWPLKTARRPIRCRTQSSIFSHTHTHTHTRILLGQPDTDGAGFRTRIGFCICIRSFFFCFFFCVCVFAGSRAPRAVRFGTHTSARAKPVENRSNVLYIVYIYIRRYTHTHTPRSR